MPFVKIDAVDPMQLGEAAPVGVPIKLPAIEGVVEERVFVRTLDQVMDNGAMSARSTSGGAQLLNQNDMRNHARQYRTNPAKVKV